MKGFNVSEMVESCIKEKPSKLVTMILSALRKLPRCKGVLYYGSHKKLRGKTPGSFVQCPFIVATQNMSTISLVAQGNAEDRDNSHFDEIYRLEEGWGYDISEFSHSAEYYVNSNGGTSKNTLSRYHIFIVCLALQSEGEIVLLEPWRVFQVTDPGISRGGSRTSIVPLKMVESDLAYEKEIVPGVLRHAIKTLTEEGDNMETAAKMLRILAACPLGTKCISFITSAFFI